MKKKIFMLLAAMVLMLTACNKTEAVITKETEKATEAEAEEAVKKAETALEETEDALEEAEAAEEFTKGELTAEGWESKWLGIRYMAPSDTAMATEEELNSMMGLGQEVLSEDFNDLQLQYAELTTVYEMMCMSQDQVTNIMVTIEKLPIAMDIDTYISSFEKTLSRVSAMTYTVVGSDEVIKLGERKFTRVKCVADYNGVEIYQDYCIAIVEDRAVSVTVTYLDEVAAENILSGFEAY